MSCDCTGHRNSLCEPGLCSTGAGTSVAAAGCRGEAGGSSGAVILARRRTSFGAGERQQAAGRHTNDRAGDHPLPSSLAFRQSAWLHAAAPQAGGQAHGCCGCRITMQDNHGVRVCNGGGAGDEMVRDVPRSMRLSVAVREAVVPPPPVDARRAVRLRSMLFSLAAAHSAGDMVSRACSDWQPMLHVAIMNVVAMRLRRLVEVHVDRAQCAVNTSLCSAHSAEWSRSTGGCSAAYTVCFDNM